MDLACEFYFPGLVESINQLTVETDDNTESKAEQSEDFKVHSPVLPPLLKTDSYPSLELASDAMKGVFYSLVRFYWLNLADFINCAY